MTTRRNSPRSLLLSLLLLGACATTREATGSSDPETATSPISESAPGPTTTQTADAATSPTTSPGEATTTTPIDAPTTTPPPAQPAADLAFSEPQQAAFLTTMQGFAATLPNTNASAIATVRHTDGRLWSAAVNAAGALIDSAPPPVRLASVGKTFTAATVFKLIEDGRLGFDDSIDAYLLPDTQTLLSADGYDLSAITVRQLLQHTSGIFDYAFGEGSPMLDRALTDQSHVWTRREQLELAVSVGDPLSDPGTAFHYSDTNYILLGEIIERLAGQPLPAAIRDLLDYDRLELTSTWMESGEQVPQTTGPIARSFFTDTEITDLDFSIDAFGGGGLASSTTDVTRFYEALIGGDILSEPTLALMTEVPDANLNLDEFGVQLGDGASGLYRLDLPTLGTCWSHRGFTGIITVNCPDVGATVAITTNTALTDPLPAAIELLAAAAEP